MKKPFPLFLINKKSLLAFLIILSLLIISSGYNVYKKQEYYIRQQKYWELKTIADLKQNRLNIGRINEMLMKKFNQTLLFFCRRHYTVVPKY